MGPLKLALLTVLVCIPIPAQDDLWRGVNHRDTPASVKEVTPPPSQREAIAKLLRGSIQNCESDDPRGEWLKHLRYRTVPLSRTAQVLLVEAGPGCARGGQGSNGAMWLIRVDGREAVLLAGGRQDFDGYLYSIESSQSHEFHDVILGWHVSGFESALTYFRFDGKSYRSIGQATAHFDEHGLARITPR